MTEKIIKVHSHPEAKSSEIYLGNFDSLEGIGWITKRFGTTAYDIYGKPIKTYSTFRPVFVQRRELEAAGFRMDVK